MSPWKWWIAIAGTTLVVGGVVWLLKLWVIVATDGRVTHTGAAASFLELGLVLLLVGSTGVGVRLAMNQDTSMRVVLAVASPLVFVGIGYLLGGVIAYAIVVIGGAIVGVSPAGYLLAEAGILGLAVVGIAVGMWLVVDVVLRGTTHGSDAASGSREAGHQPRVG
jgi:hypothetical protein